MKTLVVAIASGWLVFLCFGLYARERIRDNNRFRKRLKCVAGLLTNQDVADEPVGGESIFRPVEGRSALARTRTFVESRYPLLDVPRALPKAVAFGGVAAAGAWFSMWFLDIPSGWWTTPALGGSGVAATWYALSWFQARRTGEFIGQFSEIVDQIVRLAGAGVPALSAISIVAEDAQPPVAPVLRNIRDGLMAGLDADTVLLTASRRVKLAEFTLFAAVIRLQRRAGGGISEALSNLATTLRERRNTALKVHASTAQTRLTLLVLTLMPVAVLLAQKFAAPQSVDMLFNTDQGLMLLRGGVVLIVFGLLVARTIAIRGVR